MARRSLGSYLPISESPHPRYIRTVSRDHFPKMNFSATTAASTIPAIPTITQLK
jgi:hypothetical protein